MNRKTACAFAIATLLTLGGIAEGAEIPSLTMTELAAEGQLWVDGGGDAEALLKELRAYHQQEVSLRGFLCHLAPGQWVLASQPSLRSCCIGDKERATLQVVLDKPFSEEEAGKAVTVRGRLFVEPEWDDEGYLTKLYRIEGADLESVGASRFPVIPVAGLVVVAGVAGAFIVRRRRG